MAFCPQCTGEMGMLDTVCPHCGHDFSPEPSIRRTGFAHSRFANVILTLAAIVSVVAAIGVAGSGFAGNLIVRFAYAILLLGLFIVFIRVRQD